MRPAYSVFSTGWRRPHSTLEFQLTEPRLYFTLWLNNIMPVDTLSNTFFALADPTRRAILARLAQGETSVKELIRPLRISGPAVTKHLKILERSRLISRSRRSQWRPCKMEAAPLQEIASWVEQYRAYWGRKL